MTLCSHCHHDPVRRNGLCNSCSLYEHRTGHLPSAKVLYNRGRMREQRAYRVVAILTDVPEFMALLRELYSEERNPAA